MFLLNLLKTNQKKNKEIENILDFVSNQETERCSFFAYKRTLIMNYVKSEVRKKATN